MEVVGAEAQRLLQATQQEALHLLASEMLPKFVQTKAWARGLTNPKTAPLPSRLPNCKQGLPDCNQGRTPRRRPFPVGSLIASDTRPFGI